MTAIRIPDLVAEASAATGISIALIRSPSRARSIARARFAVAWAAGRGLGYSSARTARALQRDRTTISHAIRCADALRDTDPDFHRVSERLLTFIEGHVG